jgi:hypothetical protein
MTHNGVVAADGRLADWISLGVLASSVPRDAVDEVVAAAAKGARRSDGKLPPHVMVYFATALALFAEEDPGGRRPADRDPGVVGMLGRVAGHADLGRDHRGPQAAGARAAGAAV